MRVLKHFGSALLMAGTLLMATSVIGAEFQLHLQSQPESPAGSGKFKQVVRDASWQGDQTAVIVCDVWDLHHCLNAVRRLEEFAPRMNEVLQVTRRAGATIIHAPSDCMPAYETHPARLRAIKTPVASTRPKDIRNWCSRIASEEQAVYPIDQSDGGEDDDPAEHAQWAAKLKALGRNPGTPWMSQSPLIEIDRERDFISDRGDEVWNILEARGIKNVILVGVHTNMCVLGRPFGLRQMARNGKQVVLLRDLTDSMYNPKCWPYVDHFSGHDLVMRHVERFVCPTITSDQVLGGVAFRSKLDLRSERSFGLPPKRSPCAEWAPMKMPSPWSEASAGAFGSISGGIWYRSVIRLPKDWTHEAGLRVVVEAPRGNCRAWLNGKEFAATPAADDKHCSLQIASSAVTWDDANLLVLQVTHANDAIGLRAAPVVVSGQHELALKGRWQFRVTGDASLSNIPLPAKFGGATDMFFEAPHPSTLQRAQ